MSPSTPISPQLAQEGVHLIGDFKGQTALCAVARDMADLMQALKLPVEVLDLPISPARMSKPGVLDLSQVQYVQPRSSISIINWNGDVNPILASQLPRQLFEGRKIVGIWYWETEVPPPSLIQGYDLVDEVWVTSKFIADSLSRTSPVPIRHFPHLLTQPQPPPVLELPPALQNDRFMFLFCFDFRSVSRRKNPHGVCEAFIKAFPTEAPGGPLCVIKSIAGRSDHWMEYAELAVRYRHRPDIIFMDDWLSVEQRDSLMARTNCYVSLHRAEGLGLTLMECMALGKPCIATAFSGNLDFMDAENSWLIPYTRQSVGEGAWPYPPDHHWAEPDLEAAAAAMKEACTLPQLTEEKGIRSCETITKNHGFAAVSSRMVELLESTLQQTLRVKPALTALDGPPAGKKQAASLLKKSKDLAKAVRKESDAIRGLFLPSEVKTVMQSLLDLIQLQQQIQQETLQEVNQLRSRLRGYHDAKFSGLLRDRDLTRKLLSLQLDRDTTSQPPSAEGATPS